MTGDVFRRGDRVELRPVEEDDLPFLQRLFAHPKTRRHRREPAVKPLTAVESWYEETSEADDEYTFLLTADGERVGLAAVRGVERIDGRACPELHVHPDHRGQGYGTDAARELVTYLVEEQRLPRLRAEVLASNEAGQRVLGETGFEREGRYRQARFVDGEYVDVVAYGLLATE